MTIRFPSTSVSNSFSKDKIDLINCTVVGNFLGGPTSISGKALASKQLYNINSTFGLRRVSELALTIGDAGIINYIQR